MRPLLTVVFVPSTPMNEDKLSTSGSCRMTFAKACCRSAIASNEIVCGDSEIPEQPAHDVAHEQERDQHGHERNGEREDCEADLLCALECRLERRITLFDITRDVLDHNNGVVHHEAGRDGQGHEGEVVQAVAEQVHHAEGSDEP